MILYVLTVRDRAADVYGQPSYHTSVGAAIRAFNDEVNRDHEHNVMFRHPEDFDLYLLGEYDDALAKFELGAPRQVAVGKDAAGRRRKAA